MQEPKLLRIRDVLSLIPVSKRSIYRMIERGEFPKPVRLSPSSGKTSAVAWLHSDIIDFISRIEQSRAPSASPEPAEA